MSAPGDGKLRLAVSDLPSGRLQLPAGKGNCFFLYVRSGIATVGEEQERVALEADQGSFVRGTIDVRDGSEAWLFAVTTGDRPGIPGEIVLSHPAAPAFEAPYLIRADRIESQPGASTPRHGHRGPGLRRLVAGRLHAEVGDHLSRVNAGGAWFETGDDPVIGTNIGAQNTVFVRLMVLPLELEGGKSSFVPMNADEAGRPRSVLNRLFGETRLSLVDEAAPQA